METLALYIKYEDEIVGSGSRAPSSPLSYLDVSLDSCKGMYPCIIDNGYYISMLQIQLEYSHFNFFTSQFSFTLTTIHLIAPVLFCTVTYLPE